MEDFKKLELVWLGVTELERDIRSKRIQSLAHTFGRVGINFPTTTTGMETYDDMMKGFLDFAGEYDIIATDQEKIDESWEDFFVPENWGKKIIQYKDGEWKEVKPGFSMDNSRK